MDYKGIETVPPETRAKQQALTEALWKELKAQGLNARSFGRISGFFMAKSIESATALSKSLPDWKSRIEHLTESKEYLVEITTPEVQFSLSAFSGLTDICLIAAHDSGTTFDGLQVAVHKVGNLRKKWWQFW